MSLFHYRGIGVVWEVSFYRRIEETCFVGDELLKKAQGQAIVTNISLALVFLWVAVEFFVPLEFTISDGLFHAPDTSF